MKGARKSQLTALLGALAPPEAPAPETKSAIPRVRSLEAAPGRIVSGSVQAMSRSLGELGAAAEEAASLRARLASGEAVVALDPALIDPSFVSDRLGGIQAEGADFEAFLADLRDHGQKVPILVRPHPEAPGRYQIAYGHRRLAAAAALGRPVQAQVRALTDAELVVAQGQENAQRRDLSFIEKAFFAEALSQRGFDRATLVAALAVQTAEITRLLAVARAIPPALARAIGPAPKAGRPRWMALAARVADEAARRRAEAAANLPGVDSDSRFARAYQAAEAKAPSPAPAGPDIVLRDGRARPLARLERRGTAAVLTLDEAAAPDFARHVANALPALYAEWQGRRKSAP
ncbi:MAG: plasmid partitioning protein RepB [Proteobacteria bacterium]|nr:plasmid partitioning protein RepB [Pseudomonadota bacterium]